MPSISTLVSDINKMVGEASEISLGGFSDRVSAAYKKQVTKRPDKERKDKTLYFSEIGDPCPRRIWYKYNTPLVGETLSPSTRIKFLYGDMLEELVLQLARDAGHTVECEQKEVQYDIGNGWCIRGRIDAVIDGALVDVKSVTKQSERKFHDNLAEDPFGYYDQLNGYTCGLGYSYMGFLTIQKELGHIHYFPFIPSKEKFSECCERAVSSALILEDKRVDSVPQSATSKNLKLATTCSYCPYKLECWKDCNDGEGLRGFAYSNKVEFLTKVVDVPRVAELDLKNIGDNDDE